MGRQDKTKIRLDLLQDELLQNINLQKLNSLLDTIDVIKANSLSPTFLQVGERACDFSLEQNGQIISLDSLCKQSNVLLIFTRGGWCPYCYLQLRDLQSHLQEFEKLNTTIVAISAEKQNYCLSTTKRHGLSYKVLSDPTNSIAKKYKLLYQSQSSLNLFSDLGLEDAILNGEISYQLPVPASFFINQQKIIRYRFINPDYKQRPKADEILNAIRNLQ